MTHLVSRAGGPARTVQSPLQYPVAGGLVVVATAHIPVIPAHLREATYMGLAFVLFTFACLAVAAVVLIRDTVSTYLLAAFLCCMAVLTYAATRIVAFPLLADDVGNWAEPLGVLSVAAEVLVAAVALGVARATSRVVQGRDAPRSPGSPASDGTVEVSGDRPGRSGSGGRPRR